MKITDKNNDWDDDSGVIHSKKTNYNITKEDGWQDNHDLFQTKHSDYKMRKIKGKQFGFTYETDDYRKVIPGYIIGTVFIILFGIILTIFVPSIGVFVDVFGIVWIIGMWKKAPFIKWKNQSERLKEERASKKK